MSSPKNTAMDVTSNPGKTLHFTERSLIEYVAVIVNVEGEDLMTAANRSRTLVEQSSIPYDEGIRVTNSIGATLARKDDTIDSLVRRADQLMYRSKQACRNRVIAHL